MIRVQQNQITDLQADHPSSADLQHGASQSQTFTAASPHRRETFSRSISSTSTQPGPRSPAQRPATLSRQSSRALSATSSPSLRPLSSGYGQEEWLGSVVRDESAFCQAETQMLNRENQMLKHRIRELGMLMTDVLSRVLLTMRTRTPAHRARECVVID